MATSEVKIEFRESGLDPLAGGIRDLEKTVSDLAKGSEQAAAEMSPLQAEIDQLAKAQRAAAELKALTAAMEKTEKSAADLALKIGTLAAKTKEGEAPTARDAAALARLESQLAKTTARKAELAASISALSGRLKANGLDYENSIRNNLILTQRAETLRGKIEALTQAHKSQGPAVAASADSAGVLGSAWAKGALLLGGATAAFYAVSGAIRGALSTVGAWVTAANEAERASAKLDYTLGQLNGATADQIAALKEQAAALQEATGYDGDAIIAAQARLATQKLSAEQISALTPLLLDLAEASRKMGDEETDLETISLKLAKAYQGNGAALEKFGVNLTETEKALLATGDATTRMEVITKALDRSVGGLAGEIGGTFEGAIRKANAAAGDFSEALGGQIAESDAAQNAVKTYTEALKAAPAVIGSVINGLAKIGPTLATITAGFVGLKVAAGIEGVFNRITAASASARQELEAKTAALRNATVEEQANATATATAARLRANAAASGLASARQQLAASAQTVAAAQAELAQLKQLAVYGETRARAERNVTAAVAAHANAERIAAQAEREHLAASIALTNATNRRTAAESAGIVGAGRLAGAWAGLATAGRGLLGIVGGLPGLILTAGAALLTWTATSGGARAAADSLTGSLDDLQERMGALKGKALQKELDTVTKAIAELQAEAKGGASLWDVYSKDTSKYRETVERINELRAYQNGLTAEIERMAGPAGQAAAAAKALGIANEEAAAKYKPHNDALALATSKRQAETAAIQAGFAVRIAEQQGIEQAAKARGDETAALVASAEASRLAALAAQQEAESKRQAAAESQASLAILQAEAAAANDNSTTRQKTIQDLAAETAGKREAATQAEALAAKLGIEAQAAALAAKTHGDQSGMVRQLATEYKAAAAALDQAIQGHAAGRVSLAELAIAQQGATDAQKRYNDAQRDGREFEEDILDAQRKRMNERQKQASYEEEIERRIRQAKTATTEEERNYAIQRGRSAAKQLTDSRDEEAALRKLQKVSQDAGRAGVESAEKQAKAAKDLGKTADEATKNRQLEIKADVSKQHQDLKDYLALLNQATEKEHIITVRVVKTGSAVDDFIEGLQRDQRN